MSSNCNYGSGVFTTSYTYGSDDKEYIFSCKGRPFGPWSLVLVSHNLPTPTTSLVDYNLIKELGLKLSDVGISDIYRQYRKFCFGGQKMKILGRISIAV